VIVLWTNDISGFVVAQQNLDSPRKWWPWIKHLFVDGGYDRTCLMDKAGFLDFTIEVVRRIDAGPGFKV
jgi:putative transposase